MPKIIKDRKIDETIDVSGQIYVVGRNEDDDGDDLRSENVGENKGMPAIQTEEEVVMEDIEFYQRLD